MKPIRIYFGPMPEMLRTIMHDLIGVERDIIIAGSSATRDDCLREARQAKADIVLVQDRIDDSQTCLDLMLSKPSFGLFAVATDGHSATRVSFARHSVSLDSQSPSNLAGAIRAMAAELRASVPHVQEADANSASDR